MTFKKARIAHKNQIETHIKPEICDKEIKDNDRIHKITSFQ